MKNTNMLLVLGILVLLIYFSGIANNLGLGCITCSDFTINSISATQIISNDADLQTANFIVTATVNTGGQSVVGTFDGSDFKQLSGYQTTYPLQISIGNIKEVITYPIVNQGQVIKYSPTWSAEMSQTDVIKKCQESTADYCYRTLVREEWSGLYRYYKALEVRTVIDGSNGIIDNPNVVWSGDMTVSVNGLSQTKSIGSGQTDPSQLTLPSIDFYSGNTFIANAAWQGSLLTGQATPYPGLFRATYSSSSPKWRVSPILYWDNYKSSFDNSKTTQNGWKTTGNIDCANNGKWDAQCTDVFNIINAHNSVVDILFLQDTKITSVTGTSESLSSSTSGGVNNGFVIESTARRIMNPQLTLRVAAKNLGVLIPVGKPEIVSISEPSIPSGATGTVNIVVKNIGSASGVFSASFIDPSGQYSPTTTAQNVAIDAGQSGTIVLGISTKSVTADTTKTVTYRVFEVNSPSKYAEQTAKITTTTPLICTPGSSRVVGTNVYRCNNDGKGETLIVSCPTGVLQFDETTKTYSCNTSGGGNGDNFEIFLKSWFSSPLMLVLIIMTAILLITVRKKK